MYIFKTLKPLIPAQPCLFPPLLTCTEKLQSQPAFLQASICRRYFCRNDV